jgi:hypothetical protein
LQNDEVTGSPGPADHHATGSPAGAFLIEMNNPDTLDEAVNRGGGITVYGTGGHHWKRPRRGTTMAEQVVDWAGSDRPGVRAGAAPEMAVRMVAALLALAIAAVHVADQGGISSFASPDWIGWSYRLIEVGGVLTAVMLLIPWSAWLGWAAAVLLGAGPFAAYIASRSVGIPGDHGDVGDWGYWVGTVSLVVEAALIVLGITMLMAYRQRAGQRLVVGRLGQLR